MKLSRTAAVFACLILAACGDLPPDAPTSADDAPTSADPTAPLDTTVEVPVEIPDEPLVVETPNRTTLEPIDEVIDAGPVETRTFAYTVDASAESTFFQRLNDERQSKGLRTLQKYWDLEDDAHAHTQRMIDADDLHHNPNLTAVAGPVWDRLGENVGVGGTASALHDAFMRSEGHRDNILGDYTHVGIGAQRSDNGTLWVTVVFMKTNVPGIEDTYGPFVDDDFGTHEYGISRIAAEGITVGCDSSGRRYCPEHSVTRGQMAAFLVRAFDLPTSTVDRFNDDDGAWYEGVANTLAASGITVGCGPSKYCGNDAVTRGQMAVFLTRALDLPPASQDYFTDDAGRFYEDAANRMYESGITRGCGGTRYCGQNDVTRAQMATFLTRALGL